MNEETIHDDILFDRLVDGELSDAERRRLLASLDDRPDGWRRCALAFLEAQSWGSDMGQLVRDEKPAPVRATAVKPATSAPGDRSPLRQGLAWLAIAASLLVAVTLILKRPDDGPPIATAPPETESQLVESAPPDRAVPDDAIADGDALTLWVRDDAGRTRPVRVPLVDAGKLDRELGLSFQSAIPAAVRERLQERGYDLQSKRRYAPLWLENGRPMIVPVEDTQIVPVSQYVY